LAKPDEEREPHTLRALVFTSCAKCVTKSRMTASAHLEVSIFKLLEKKAAYGFPQAASSQSILIS
jgi:hypothetical protein